MRPKTTPLTAQRAFETIKVVARAMIDGEGSLAYGELAERIGMPNKTGQGLGVILDEAARRCAEHGLPNVSVVIVTKASKEAGRPMPLDDSFDSDGHWRLTGAHRSEIPAMQDAVRSFDWRSKPALGLG